MPKRYINYDYLRVKIEIISAFSYNNNWIKMCFWLSSFTSAIKGSEGQFPACLCGEGKVYVHERDECVVIDRSQCPVGSRKVNNKCICDSINDFKYEFDEIFWICRPWYIPTTPAPPKPCPAHQHRVGDSCEWDRCPSAYESKTGVFYWKFCEIVSNLAFWRRKNHWNLKKSIKSAQTKVTGRIVCQFERAIKKEKLDNIQTAMLLLSYNNVDRIRLGSSQTATGFHVQTLTSQNQVIW